MEEILTAEQVAQILQVHQFTVLKFIKQGKLKASKLGRVYRIRKSDVDSFLDNQAQKVIKKTKKEDKVDIEKVDIEKKIKSPDKNKIKKVKPKSVVVDEIYKDSEEVENIENEGHYILELKE